jgi:hypothetical protein
MDGGNAAVECPSPKQPQYIPPQQSRWRPEAYRKTRILTIVSLTSTGPICYRTDKKTTAASIENSLNYLAECANDMSGFYAPGTEAHL